VSYETPKALRVALENRLLARSQDTGISLDRLRRRVLFERILARLQVAEPGLWVLKGGMALEVRLRDDARLTKDLDLGLRADLVDVVDLEERLIGALSVELAGDRFVLTVSSVRRMAEDDGGRSTWRAQVSATLAGTMFGGLQIDVSARANELDSTDLMTIPNSMEFAGIESPQVEVVDLQRHVAEKFHGMLKVFDDRINTRVRDLIDLVLLDERGLIHPALAAAAVRAVWDERGDRLPAVLPELSGTWDKRYEQLASDLNLDARILPAAIAVVTTLWSEMFPQKES